MYQSARRHQTGKIFENPLWEDVFKKSAQVLFDGMNYTDHLGNVRVSYTKDPQNGTLQILEESHYYPFGLKHEVYVGGGKRDFGLLSIGGGIGEIALKEVLKTEYQYEYNGKEWQDELGLNMYAMDMRQYDPAIARWVVQDPIVHFNQSPYSSFDGNPVYWADPSGADAESRLKDIFNRSQSGDVWTNDGSGTLTNNRTGETSECDDCDGLKPNGGRIVSLTQREITYMDGKGGPWNLGLTYYNPLESSATSPWSTDMGMSEETLTIVLNIIQAYGLAKAAKILGLNSAGAATLAVLLTNNNLVFKSRIVDAGIAESFDWNGTIRMNFWTNKITGVDFRGLSNGEISFYRTGNTKIEFGLFDNKNGMLIFKFNSQVPIKSINVLSNDYLNKMISEKNILENNRKIPIKSFGKTSTTR